MWLGADKPISSYPAPSPNTKPELEGGAQSVTILFIDREINWYNFRDMRTPVHYYNIR